MNCKHCKNVVSDTMKFCPYCGSKIASEKTETVTNIYEQITTWYKNNQYEKILEEALNGNNISKCYFITYLSNEQSSLSDEPLLKTINNLADSGHPFALSALGIRKFNRGQNNLLGYKNEDLIKQGVELITKAAELGEVSAITFVANWMITGKHSEKNPSTAYTMMKSAADCGYPSAMYYLGSWHKDGLNGISKNEEYGFELIERAAFFGDANALEYFKINNPNWFSSNLDYAIPKEVLQRTKTLASSHKSIIPKEKTDVEASYENCKTTQDYVGLYKLIRDEFSDDNNTKDLFDLLTVLVTNVTGYALDKVTLEEAEAATELAKKVVQLTDKYECPQHYLHFKEDLKTLEIDVDEESIPGLLKIVSKTISKKYPNEIDSYVKYANAKKDAKSAQGTGCIFIGLIVIAILLGIFLPVIGIVVGVLALLFKIGQIATKNEFKKMPTEIRQDYLIINALIGYGYTPVDPDYYENKYDPADTYENNVASVLSTFDSIS